MTGGAGFIGANLCRTLAATGNDVVALDDLSTGTKDNLRGVDAELIEGTILDRETLDAALRGTDAVVHLAALPSVPRSIADPMATHLANATGTLEVLEAARRAARSVPGDHVGPHTIVASSSSVYGANPTLPKHEDLATFPMSPYGASKLASEAYALAYQHSYGLPVLVFRFFNVFGPLQGADHAYAAAVPTFAAAALAGRPIVVEGDGHQTRDFTYVGTVVAVIADALARRVTEPLAREPRVRDPHRDPRARAHARRAGGPPARDRAHRRSCRRRPALAERSDPPARAVPRRRSPRSARRAPRHPRLVPQRSMTKRAFDLSLTSALLVLLSPVIAVVALLGASRDGAPGVVPSAAAGRGGRPFSVLKFRTMIDQRDANGDLLPDEARLTTVGRFLRRTSLDELPELVNVLRGDMSLVGPRPLLMDYLPRYTPEQMRRHDVRPGITGWAQVNGRNALTWDEKFALDVWYVDHHTLRLDIDILRRTVGEVLGGRGVDAPAPFQGSAPEGVPVTDIIVVGGGDQGRQVISAIEAGEGDRIVGLLDRAIPPGTVVAGYPVLGIGRTTSAPAPSTTAHARSSSRSATTQRAVRPSSGSCSSCPQLSLYTVVHPAASVARDATVGEGSIVLAGAVVSNGCAVGRAVLLGTRSSIDHDCVVADYASLAPGVTTGGTVRVGRATALGVGANVVHGITIGADTVVGAGALVLEDIPERVVAYGVPAVVARTREPGERVPLAAMRARFAILLAIVLVLFVRATAHAASGDVAHDRRAAHGRREPSHVPPAHAASASAAEGDRRQMPLVVVLHGAGATAAEVERRYHWDPLADREHFVVAYPQAIDRRWDDEWHDATSTSSVRSSTTSARRYPGRRVAGLRHRHLERRRHDVPRRVRARRPARGHRPGGRVVPRLPPGHARSRWSTCTVSRTRCSGSKAARDRPAVPDGLADWRRADACSEDMTERPRRRGDPRHVGAVRPGNRRRARTRSTTASTSGRGRCPSRATTR